MKYKCVCTVREQWLVWKLCFTDGNLNSDYGAAKWNKVVSSQRVHKSLFSHQCASPHCYFSCRGLVSIYCPTTFSKEVQDPLCAKCFQKQKRLHTTLEQFISKMIIVAYLPLHYTYFILQESLSWFQKHLGCENMIWNALQVQSV